MAYKKKLTDPRWQKKRLEILKRDKWKCRLCKDTETELHVHHLEYTGDPWEAPDKDLITLCAHCHYEVEKLDEGYDFKNIKVFKSDTWKTGDRIMFVRNPDNMTMRIFDENDDYVIGFRFVEEDFGSIKRIMNG